MDGDMKRGLIYNFICFAVRLFVRRPAAIGLEKFSAGRGSMIVANHEGAWGPVVTRAWLPLPTAPWVNWQITRRKYCRQFLSGFFFMEQAHMKGWIARPLGVILEPLLVHLLRVGDAVPVYFSNARVTITYKKSLEMLKAGKTLMVFPDDESTLQDLYVPGFHDGYLATAKLYYKQTEKKLLIYPLCLSSRRNLMALGEPVEFDPDKDFKEECARINEYLLAFIRERYVVQENKPIESNQTLSI
jgi:1-acyl-sn-glycerol-3-phosphate acyltransferase